MTRFPHIPFPRALGLLALMAFLAPSSATGEDLANREGLAIAAFRAGGEPTRYARLTRDDRASYLFCGQGELRIASRAVLPKKTGTARYTLDLVIDGERPGRELAYRVGAVADATFDQHDRAGALRRTSINLHRGCHTAEVTLARSTVDAVAIRLSWMEREQTRRRWDAVDSVGGTEPRALVEVGDSRTPYHELGAGQSLELTVDGPAWVRLLARSVGEGWDDGYGLRVERRGKDYRTYQLDSLPSRRARLAGQPGKRLGRANEVVFAVGQGSQRLTVQPTSGRLLVRPQVAERAEGRLPGTLEPGWAVRARLASYYDDNILRYSEKFIQRFEDGRDPDRFRVESLDDTVTRTDLYIDRDFDGLAGKPARFGLVVGHRDFLRNDIKDWTSFSVSWEQEMRRSRQLELSVSWSPDFYVRHLRDSDLTGGGQTADPFQAFAFERGEGRLRFSHELGATFDVRYHLGLATFRHSEAFREFDSENLFAGIRLNQRLTQRLRLSYAVEYTDSDARGYDQAGETLATSDDTDPAYRQLDLMFAARVRLPGERRQILFLQAETGQRDYTTDKSPNLAPLHSGREDDLLRIYASWQLDLSRRYGLTVFAQSRERSSSAPIDLDIGVEKDFDQWEAGLRLTARFGDG